MTSKTGSLKFDINANTKRTIKASIQFSTQDKGTAQLLFSLTKDGAPLPLSAATVKLALQMADGSKFVRNVDLLDKVEGRAAYVLSDEEITHYGNVSAELYVYYNNNRSMSVHKFGFNIEAALIDQNIVPAAEYYVDDFESLKAIVTELYDDSIELLDAIKAKFEDLGAIETKAGAQEKVDAHADNADVHVTTQKKAEWDAKETPSGAQAKVTAHANDVIKHVTNEERAAWNSKETTVGAQMKVDAHESKVDIHVNGTDKSRWDAGQLYKLTLDNGKPVYKGSSEVTDYNNMIQSGFYLIYNEGVNAPPLANVFLNVVSNGNTVLQTAYDAKMGLKAYFRILKLNSGWSEWVAKLTSETLLWKFPTINNGWSTYKGEVNNDYRVRYTKNALGVVHVMGVITGGTIGDVPAFVLDVGYRPLVPFYNVGLATSANNSSVPQISRQYISTDGRVCIQSTSSTNDFIAFNFSFQT